MEMTSERRTMVNKIIAELEDWGWDVTHRLDWAENGGKYHIIGIDSKDGAIEGNIDVYGINWIQAHASSEDFAELEDELNGSSVFDDIQDIMNVLADFRDKQHELFAQRERDDLLISGVVEFGNCCCIGTCNGDPDSKECRSLPTHIEDAIDVARRAALREANGCMRAGNTPMAKKFADIAIQCGANRDDIMTVLGLV